MDFKLAFMKLTSAFFRAKSSSAMVIGVKPILKTLSHFWRPHIPHMNPYDPYNPDIKGTCLISGVLAMYLHTV